MIVELLFMSCARILNNGVQKITITCDKAIKIISVDSSLKTLGDDKSYYIERSKNPIKIKLQLDTANKTLLIKPHSSLAYWANIYFNYGIGMLIDKGSPKRYSYPKRIYIQYKKKDVIISRFAPTPKGSIYWHFALPHANSFYIKTNTGHRNSEGFWGIESGLDYFYKNNQYVSVYAGAATDYFVPVPAAVDIFGEYQSSSGKFLNVKNNYRIGSFDLGYGVSYSTLLWRKKNYADSTFTPKSKSNSAIGFSFTSSFRFSGLFQIGFLYQPYFISIDNKVRIDYQHQISMELIWKIPIRKVLLKE